MPVAGAVRELVGCHAAEDLVEVFRRRRPANRIGHAAQLGYLRHPGRAIEPGEAPPAAMLAVLAAQIGCAPDAFAEYATRNTKLREHRAAIERRPGLRAFNRTDRGMVFATASEVATSTDRCDAIVAVMVERLRGAGEHVHDARDHPPVAYSPRWF